MPSRDAAWSFNDLIRAIHDGAVREGVYRAKREGESWFWWWQAYQHDVLGEDTQDLSGAWVHAS